MRCWPCSPLPLWSGWGAGWLGAAGWPGASTARVLLLFAGWVAVNTALLVYYNLEFVQYQGRYLFSSLIPIALFLMVGLGAVAPRPLRWLPGAALLLFLLYLDVLALVERLPGMLHY